MFVLRKRLSFFACHKDAAGAALKEGGSGQQKDRLMLHPNLYEVAYKICFQIFFIWIQIRIRIQGKTSYKVQVFEIFWKNGSD